MKKFFKNKDMLKVNYFKKVKCPFEFPLIKKVSVCFQRNIKNKFKRGEIDIVIICDKEMVKINSSYRFRNKTTDVLSFAFKEDKKIKSEYIGQIFISYPQIRRQAKQYKITEREEFIRMLVHGLLHLAGYDHKSKDTEEKMFILQEKIVNEVLKIL